jgi:hypothetical protein
LTPHARRRQRGLGTGVPTAHNDDIETCWINHGRPQKFD